MNDNLKTKEINFFEKLKKPNEMARSQTINERNEKVVRANL